MEQQQKVVTEDDLIDYIFSVLYSNLNKNELHLQKDILAPTKVELDENQIEHLRELLLSTGFVKNSVGFGKSEYVYLTAQGIQMMKTHGSYLSFLRASNQHTGEPNVASNQNQTNPAQNSGFQNLQSNSPANFPEHGGDDMAH
jgi:hypothetical protein